MILNLTIVDTSFQLMMSSSESLSEFSVNYINKTGDKKDAVVQLGNFNGTLHIRHLEDTNTSQIHNQLEKASKEKIALGENTISSEKDKQNFKSQTNESSSPADLNTSTVGSNIIIPNRKNLLSSSSSESKKVSFVSHDLHQTPQLKFSSKNNVNLSSKKSSLSKESTRFNNSIVSKNLYVETDSKYADETYENEGYPKTLSYNHSIQSGRSDITSCDSFDSEESFNSATFDDFLSKVSSTKGEIRRENLLHTMCKSETCKIKDLIKVLKSNPRYASMRDEKGRCPLHLISENKNLFNRKKMAVQSFVEILLKVYPDAVIALDDNNRVPFTGNIESWIQETNEESQVDNIKYSFTDEQESYPKIPLVVEVPLIVEWSFKMLSRFIHDRYRNTDIKSVMFDASYSSREQIIENFCSIPDVLKTVLLINDDKKRSNILDTSIVRCSLVNPELAGDWIVAMLRSRNVYKRANDFFEIISHLTTAQALDLKVKPKNEDHRTFFAMREQLFIRISQLQGIISSLCLLNKSELTRACSTDAIQNILELSMMKSQIVCSMLFNLSSNLLLLGSFQDYIEVYLLQRENSSLLRSPWPLIFWICMYFLVYDEVLYYITVGSFEKYVKKFSVIWNLIDTTSIIFTLLVTIVTLLVDTSPSFVTVLNFAKLFLWVRIFTFLRGVNMYLATFMLVLSNSLYNLRWFLSVLFLACLAFADIISHIFQYSTTICDGVDTLTDRTVRGDYCSHSIARGVLRAYAIVIGQVDMEIYRESKLSTAVWVFFSIFGIIMLLNVLIAIVTSSYEESFLDRHHLFGTARLPVLAKHEIVRKKIKDMGKLKHARIYSTVFFLVVLIFVISFLISLLFTIVVWIDHNRDAEDQFAFKEMLMIVASGIAATALSLGLLNSVHLYCVCCNRKSAFLNRVHIINSRIAQYLAYGLLGIKSRTTFDPQVERRKMADGMINFVVTQNEESVANAEFRIISEMHDLETRIEQQVIEKGKNTF